MRHESDMWYTFFQKVCVILILQVRFIELEASNKACGLYASHMNPSVQSVAASH